MELTRVEAQNLLVFLDRVQLSAREADTFVLLRGKLREIATGPCPDAPAAPAGSPE